MLCKVSQLIMTNVMSAIDLNIVLEELKMNALVVIACQCIRPSVTLVVIACQCIRPSVKLFVRRLLLKNDWARFISYLVGNALRTIYMRVQFCEV